MSLPASVRAAVEEAIRGPEPDGSDHGSADHDRADQSIALRADAGAVQDITPVSGGCINNGARVDTVDGRTYFLKWNPLAPPGMFEAEARGLNALRETASELDPAVRPRVPQPLAHAPQGAPSSSPDWLLMEWIPSGPPTPDSDERLGRGLALLHTIDPVVFDPDGTDGHERSGRIATFGWDADNWIGSLPQSNRPSVSWSDFWRDQRIVLHLDLARQRGHLSGSLMDDLVDAIPAAVEGVEAPSLLHGDLWSGNSYVTSDGAAALVDPAVYHGDGEVDLAMTELFGGFGAAFYDAYDEVRPISTAYHSHRRALYQLYYLLVHVNLFGGSYEAGCRRAAETVLAALS